MLAGLHVASFSSLSALKPGEVDPRIHIISPDIDASDLDLLQTTLERTAKPFSLFHHQVDETILKNFPQLNQSLATYYRLFIPELLNVSRYLYLDVDILCQTDLSSLFKLKLDHPLAMVPEAPIDKCVDQGVFQDLGEKAKGYYFNAGVCLVDRESWIEESITQSVLDYISTHSPAVYDQSGINFVLHGRIGCLPEQANIRTNDRKYWPLLRPDPSKSDLLLHFIDYPKPWDWGGRWLHPLGYLWWKVYRQTAHAENQLPVRPPVTFSKFLEKYPGYIRASKDKILLSGYKMGLLSSIKGIPGSPTSSHS